MPVARIQLPDGRIAKFEVPEGTSEEAVMAQARQMMQGQIIPQTSLQANLRPQLVPGLDNTEVSGVGARRNPGALPAFARAAGSQIAGNIAGIPNVLANTARRIPAQLGLTPPEDAVSLSHRTLPTPSGKQIMAGAETALQVPGAAVRGEDIDLSAMFGQNMADAEALAAEHPMAHTLGKTGGDVATLLTGRAPWARAKAPALAARREAIESEARERLDLIPKHIKDKLSDVVSSKVVPFFKETGRLTARAGKKATETGIEGATLALLNEGDPESMFWFGAGGQAVGSASLFLVEKPIKRLVPFVASAFVVSEMFKAVAPGDQSFFESKDFAIQKANLALGLGLVSAMSGAGRLRGPTAERFPAFFDAITAVPRGAILSRLQEMTNNSEQGNELPLKIMERYARNPSAFNTNQQNALGRALNSEKAGAFTREVDRLMNDSADFRERVDGFAQSRE